MYFKNPIIECCFISIYIVLLIVLSYYLFAIPQLNNCIDKNITNCVPNEICFPDGSQCYDSNNCPLSCNSRNVLVGGFMTLMGLIPISLIHLFIISIYFKIQSIISSRFKISQNSKYENINNQIV